MLLSQITSALLIKQITWNFEPWRNNVPSSLLSVFCDCQNWRHMRIPDSTTSARCHSCVVSFVCLKCIVAAWSCVDASHIGASLSDGLLLLLHVVSETLTAGVFEDNEKNTVKWGPSIQERKVKAVRGAAKSSRCQLLLTCACQICAAYGKAVLSRQQLDTLIL